MTATRLLRSVPNKRTWKYSWGTPASLGVDAPIQTNVSSAGATPQIRGNTPWYVIQRNTFHRRWASLRSEWKITRILWVFIISCPFFIMLFHCLRYCRRDCVAQYTHKKTKAAECTFVMSMSLSRPDLSLMWHLPCISTNGRLARRGGQTFLYAISDAGWRPLRIPIAVQIRRFCISTATNQPCLE